MTLSNAKETKKDTKITAPDLTGINLEELGENAERKLRAYTMHVKGAASYRDISRTFGCSVATAFRDVQEVLTLHNRVSAHTLDEARQIQMDRLDIALFAIMPAVKKGNFYAIDRMLAIEKRRAELLGLDAAKRLEMTGKDGNPIQTETVDIRERWTPQEAAAKTQELMRRIEVAQRETVRLLPPPKNTGDN